MAIIQKLGEAAQLNADTVEKMARTGIVINLKQIEHHKCLVKIGSLENGGGEGDPKLKAQSLEVQESAPLFLFRSG